MSSRPSALRSALFNVAKIGLAVALVWWVLDTAGGWEKVRDSLSGIDRRLWFIGLSCLFLGSCISILRWYLLMRSVGLDTTPWAVFRLGWIGVFMSNVVPGLTGGDLVKAYYVTRDHPTQRADAVISVIVDRVIGIVALALIAAVIIPFDLQRYGEAALGIYGFLAAAALGFVVVFSRRIKAKLRELAARIFPQRVSDGTSLLARIDRAVSIYRQRLGIMAVALGMSLAVHLLLIVAMACFGDGLAAGADPQAHADLLQLGHLNLSVYCSVIPIIMIISSLPLAPAGWGVGEVVFVHFFATAGVSGFAATSLSLTYRLSNTLLSLLGGLFLALDRKKMGVAKAQAAGAAQDGDPSQSPGDSA
ncbi:MAG: lysylphosphatidylglycerol synthase transmembrane domain-containing protein [Planctomycetota bacterium]